MPITRAGYNRMNEELKRLKTVERRDVAQQIEIARGHGDLRENADYDAARNAKACSRQTFVLSKTSWLAQKLSMCPDSGDRVVFGARVELFDVNTEDERTVTIVGEAEADAGNGLISVTSPMARALIGRTSMIPSGYKLLAALKSTKLQTSLSVIRVPDVLLFARPRKHLETHTFQV